MQRKSKKSDTKSSVSRRTFLKSVGLSSVGAAALTGEGLYGQLREAGILPESKILGPGSFSATFQINGRSYQAEIDTHTTLAQLVRDKLELTGTKVGCDRGACGACTVILNGKSVCSCLTLAVDAINQKVETVEGLATDGQLHPLQMEFIEHDAIQCGFCTSGFIMSSKHLLEKNKKPEMNEIKKAVSGNLCRCGTYPNVFDAIAASAKRSR